MEIGDVGIEAARLMDELEEQGLPDGAEVEVVGVVVLLSYRDEADDALEDVYVRCNVASRTKQVGLFETAKHIALTSSEGDDED